MTTFPEAARRMGEATASIAGKGSEKALTLAGVEAKQEMTKGARRDTGDGQLSGYGRGRNRGRVRAEARFDKAPGLKVIVEPTKRSRGLWALLEHGSRSGQWKTPRRRGQRRARGTVGTYSRAPVPPRNTWSEAIPQARHAAFRAYHRSLVASTFRELKGG